MSDDPLAHMKIGIVAGEASGDLLGAELIQGLKALLPDCTVTGLGGPAMQAAGCHSVADMERLSVMGLIEPLFHLRDLFKLRSELFAHFLKERPDVFIGIDSPDFNLGLECRLRQKGVPVVHYVSPSIWAWRQNRIHKIAKSVDLMLTLFPFEQAIYQKYHVPVSFVGHPLANQIPMHADKLQARRMLGLSASRRAIALLPGSRRNELKYCGGLFIEVAKKIAQSCPDIQWITASANPEREREFKAARDKVAPGLAVQFLGAKSHAVLAAADLVLVTSGTAALEAMLFKRPMAIVYKMHPLTYQIARRCVKLTHIGLPNLLAEGECLVPEFIQGGATPDAIAGALKHYLDHPAAVVQCEKQFTQAHHNLKVQSQGPAAERVYSFLLKKERRAC